MFNRNNLPSVPNPFGGRPDGNARPRDPYAGGGSGPAPPRRADGYGAPPQQQRGSNYDTPMGGYGGAGGVPSRPSVGGPGQPRSGGGGSGQVKMLRLERSPNDSYTWGNL